ncbi:hypothetical protein SIID45300_01281 [Candidatus Magnetaquicoccaceae bacterium FCR-1]|uniref:Uncharacterized protein n=1 Tax=Candidatus Magnetaquiglobus chichijimensis TaxID=3141448 RepID=A0ABQ0C7V9_9PROT
MLCVGVEDGGTGDVGRSLPDERPLVRRGGDPVVVAVFQRVFSEIVCIRERFVDDADAARSRVLLSVDECLVMR